MKTQSQSRSVPLASAGWPLDPRSAFTMIEIAICLAIIGFALAAIIGVLPIGMTVQRENREETIINQDASVLVNAIRNGELGLDDLTNYVVAITNTWATYVDQYPNPPTQRGPLHRDGYTYRVSTDNGTPLGGYRPLTNGYGIVGLLSTPKYVPDLTQAGGRASFRSNYVVAYIRALSGDASEKVPQTNSEVQSLSFSYRMIAEVVPYAGFDRNWTNYTAANLSTNEITVRSNNWMLSKTMQKDLYDLRLIFRYPLLPNGTTGSGRQVFRTMVSGYLRDTNELNNVNPAPAYHLYFFEPRTYVRAQ